MMCISLDPITEEFVRVRKMIKTAFIEIENANVLKNEKGPSDGSTETCEVAHRESLTIYQTKIGGYND